MLDQLQGRNHAVVITYNMRLLILLAAWMMTTAGHAHHSLNHSIDELVNDSYEVWGGRTGDPPHIEIVTTQRFDSVVCGGPCRPSVVAAYLKGTIYLRDTWNPSDVWQASYLVHEMVHHLQDQSGLHPSIPTCEDAWRLENQAYQLQNRWLAQHQKFIPRMMMLRMIALSTGCQPDSFSVD